MRRDPIDLSRFIEAQNRVMGVVEAELTAGRKTSHWIWFIFPQIAGLGFSGTSRHFAITGREEAAAYLAHPLLGERLRYCTALVCKHHGRSAESILGSIDAVKFRSCLTLFRAVTVSPEDRLLFDGALAQFYDGSADDKTLQLLASR